jgi:poly(3-hydroxybutyrate) depolymerase
MNAGPEQRSAHRQTPKRAGTAIPLIIFHGDQDRVVTPSNAELLARRALRTSDTGGGSPTSHSPAATSGRVPHGHTYTRTTYQDAAGLVTVEYWTVHRAGHAWSGGSALGSYTDPQGPDASAEFLRFFLTHRRQ